MELQMNHKDKKHVNVLMLPWTEFAPNIWQKYNK